MNGRGCINWKVVGGLAAVGAGIWVFAPGLVSAALPLLLIAACPLSMLLMMRGMQAGQCANQDKQVTEAADNFTVSDKIGQLKTQLAQAQAEQNAVAREIAHLEKEALAAEAQGAIADAESSAVENGQQAQPPTERSERQ